MDTRTIDLALKDVPKTPATLRGSDGKDLETIAFEVQRLGHHYYLAKHGRPPRTAFFEYEEMVTAGPDWRFEGGGIGADTESKNHVSNELGKAFARWVLHDHFGFTYFAPLKPLLNKKNPDGSMWVRAAAGDLPDYVCDRNGGDVSLLEVKGRYPAARARKPIGFDADVFTKARQQIHRARLIDARDRPIAVKGFASVAQWATERTPRLRAKLLLEDPWTEGQTVGDDGYPRYVRLAIAATHYASIFERLQLLLIAEALRTGERAPQSLGIPRIHWECVFGPLKGRVFVGGVVPDATSGWWQYMNWRFALNPWGTATQFVLMPSPQFFGLEKHVFEKVLSIARGGLEQAFGLEPVHTPDHPSSVSLLRDGSVLGPAEFFRPTGQLTV